MKGARVLAWARSAPWALQPQVFSVMSSVLARWARGEIASPAVLDHVRADSAERRTRRGNSATVGGAAVAVIPVYGILSQRGNALDNLSGPGSTSTQMISEALREALADEAVGSILLDVDSPGGCIFGTQELADEIYAARARKPIVAIANSCAASAAFWIGAQASEFYCVPSGEVGSIGVILQHQDWSGADEEEGLVVTYLTAPVGGFKSEGNPHEPLSDDAKSYEQTRIDEYYGAFVAAVARGRGVSAATVRGPSWGLGRVLGAKSALDVKMVDGIRTFDEAIARARVLAKRGNASAGARDAHAPPPDAAIGPSIDRPRSAAALPGDIRFEQDLIAARIRRSERGGS